MTQLRAHQLGVQRGGRSILRDLDLQAGPGEFIAVVGPNGAGKSTLLAMLAGLLPPSQGLLHWDGKALADWPAAAWAVERAYLPQGARCEWPLRVARLVELGLLPRQRLLGAEASQDRQRVEAALQDFDLLPQREQAATTLSGGELARAMLARALVGAPRTLLVDEPLAGLDPRHMLDSLRRLRDCAVRDGMLVVASIHDLNLALRYATRLWVLHEGRLAADGEPARVMDAALLGRVFQVAGCISGDGSRAWIDYA